MRRLCFSIAWALLVLISAPVVFAQGELTQITQDFSTDPGWEWMNNRIVAEDPPLIKQDFGWGPTNHTGAGPGEIGGRIWMSRTPAYYALPFNKPLTFKDRFSFSGTIVFMPTQGAAAAYLGYFNHEKQGWRVWNSMAIRLGGESSGQAVFGVDAMNAVGDTPIYAEGYPHVPADGKPHTFCFSYDPTETRGPWPDPRLQKYIARKRQTTEQILELARQDEPALTKEELLKRLVDAYSAGWIQYLQRTGHESLIGQSPWRGNFWFLTFIEEPCLGAVTLQVDDNPPIKMFMGTGEIDKPVYMDRFGLFNLQMYHQYIDLFIGDLTVNGHKVDLSKEPGWEGKGNRVQFHEQDFQRQDFGFSETNWAGEGIGEIGGLYSITEPNDPYHGYYADDVGELTLEDPISFSGKVCFVHDSTDAGMQIGYFNSGGLKTELGATSLTMSNLHSMAVLVDDHTGGKCFGLSITSEWNTEVKKREITFQADRKPHSFKFEYDPTANNNLGRMTVTFDDQTSSMDLTAEQRAAGSTFDRFGLANTRDGGKYVMIYFDDLTYTARRPKDYKPVFHKQEVVKVPYPKGGRAY